MKKCQKIAILIICIFNFSKLGLAQPIIDSSKFCDYDALIDNVQSPEKELREDLYLQLVGVLEELSVYRNKYRNGGHFIDIFPSVYYHITSIEMNKLRIGTYQQPTWKMSQMVAFYEAYSVNRKNWDSNNKAVVEPHWVNHFTVANEQYNGVNWLCTGIQQTLNTAINAHVIYDLPRSIRFAYNNKSNPNLTENDIKPEFMAVNSSFSSALKYAVDDIEVASSFICDFFINIGQLLLPSDVVLKRQSAWYDAFNLNKVIDYNGVPLQSHPYSSPIRGDLEQKGKDRCSKKANSTLFLFDLSGSMNGNGANSNKSKLQQAKDASKVTLNSIRSNNSGAKPEVGVLGFSGGCPGSNGDPTTGDPNWDTDFQTVQNRIDGLFAGGGTPLYEAIEAAQCKLAKRLQENNQQSGKLIVLSDGAATCKKIRPQGVYNSSKVHQWKIDVDANKCGGAAAPKIKYYTIGFNINPGSSAERDLQFLAQSTGGKYLNVQSQTQLERAFRKFNRTYIPKPNPAFTNLPSSSNSQFDKGVSQINSESFTSALETYEAFVGLHTDDCNGAFNLALMQEANDFYKKAIANYKKYLSLCPNAADKDLVEKQIIFLQEEFKQFLLFQKEVIKSDLEYLKLHFEKIQNGQSIALAEEFKGFLKEKGDYYINLPELMGRTDRLFKKNTKEVADGLDNCAKTINRNPETWDRDATPVLSMTYLNLERLFDSL